jgi:hypothetical protein
LRKIAPPTSAARSCSASRVACAAVVDGIRAMC